ncbi:MAG: hypothetical protein ACR2QG_12980 [Gammaproteobacteria bacterium]
MYRFIILFAVLLLTGCSAKVTESNHRQVLIKEGLWFGTSLSKLQQLSDSECQKYDRHALYYPENTPDGKVAFLCAGR